MHQLGEAEVEDLDVAVGGDEEVRRLEVAVDDPAAVRRRQAAGDLHRVFDRLARRQRPVGHQLLQRLPLEQLLDQVRLPVVDAEVVDREDVGVVQRAGGARLVLEAAQALRVGGEHLGQHLDGDVAVQPPVARAIHLAHPAGSEGSGDLVGSDVSPDFEGHGLRTVDAVCKSKIPHDFSRRAHRIVETGGDDLQGHLPAPGILNERRAGRDCEREFGFEGTVALVRAGKAHSCHASHLSDRGEVGLRVWRSLPGITSVVVSIAVAGVATAVVRTPGQPTAPDSRAAISLTSGGQAVLAAASISAAAGFDPLQAVLEMRETAGATLVARLTPQLPHGLPPHRGRVVVLRAGERRLIRLGTVFNEEELAGNDVLVEVLRGDGRLAVRLAGAGGEGDEAEVSAEATAPTGSAAALVSPPHRTRRHLEGTALTSTDLIDRAEAAQEIDRETAVIYRVYAIVGDARLPVAYRGSDGAAFESLYLMEVAAGWDTYSPATQAALQPFLIPPAYTGSWANPAPVGVTSLETGPCSSRSPLWQYADGPRGKVRVWYWVPDDPLGTRAFALANEADTVIWPKITDFMGTHAPLSDGLSLCSGGDARLDIYLTDIGRSITAPAGFWGGGTTCSNTPVYINLNRAESKETLAHEIFHAFQFAFPIAGGACATSPAYWWWTEGSAQWIIDKVYPPSKAEQHVALHVIYHPERSFDIPVDPHIYSTYLLPFYVYRKTGSAAFVKVAWEACAGMDAVGAVDLALAGGWEDAWPELSLHNWNTNPVDDYRKWDGLSESPVKVDLPTVVGLGGAADKEFTIPFDLPKLSTTYEHFKFSDPEARSVRFWNGATFDLKESAGPFFTPVWDPKPATAAAKEGIRVQALVKIKGAWQAPVDWTNDPSISFCRDVANERIEELVLIISNSQFLDAGKRAKPPGQDPRLYVSNMGCYKWTGTTSSVISGSGSVLAVVGNPVTFTRIEGAEPEPMVRYRPTGVIAASLAGTCNGSGVFGINSAGSVFFTGNFTPLDSSGHRAFHAQAIDINIFPIACDQGQSIFGVGVWLESPVAPPFKLVGADGTTMKGTWTTPDGTGVFTWDLHSEAQP